MSNKYFGNVTTMEELKGEFKMWCKKLHPDMPNGNKEAFQDMKNEYDVMVKIMAAKEKDSEKAEKVASMYKDIMEVIIHLELKDITIHGTWIWVECSKEQKEVHKVLKELKFFFNSKRSVWQWHEPTEGKGRYSNKTESEIAATYGTIKIKGDSGNDRDGGNGKGKGKPKGLK